MVITEMPVNKMILLTGKKLDPIGPPGPMPSFGGICPNGLGAGPALCPIPLTPYPLLTNP